jgi:hypothetical protein
MWIKDLDEFENAYHEYVKEWKANQNMIDSGKIASNPEKKKSKK